MSQQLSEADIKLFNELKAKNDAQKQRSRIWNQLNIKRQEFVKKFFDTHASQADKNALNAIS